MEVDKDDKDDKEDEESKEKKEEEKETTEEREEITVVCGDWKCVCTSISRDSGKEEVEEERDEVEGERRATSAVVVVGDKLYVLVPSSSLGEEKDDDDDGTDGTEGGSGGGERREGKEKRKDKEEREGGLYRFDFAYSSWTRISLYSSSSSSSSVSYKGREGCSLVASDTQHRDSSSSSSSSSSPSFSLFVFGGLDPSSLLPCSVIDFLPLSPGALISLSSLSSLFSLLSSLFSLFSHTQNSYS